MLLMADVRFDVKVHPLDNQKEEEILPTDEGKNTERAGLLGFIGILILSWARSFRNALRIKNYGSKKSPEI